MLQTPARKKYDSAYAHTIRRRTLAIIVVWAIVLGICVYRLAYLQIFNAAGVAQEAENSRTITARVQAMRGSIVDTNGEILAQSVEAYKIYVDQVGAKNFTPTSCTPKRTRSMTDAQYEERAEELKDVCHSLKGQDVPGKGASAVARILAPVLQLNVQELGAKIAGDTRYVVVANNVTPEVKRRIDKLHLSGVVGAELISERVYSNPTLIGSILGGVNGEGKGVTGIESMEEASLQGINGVETYEQTNPIYGTAKIPGTEKVQSVATPGGTVKLTIDSDVQWYLNKELKARVENQHADWGIGVVQEIKTGRIIAISDSDQYAANSEDALTKGSPAMQSTFDPGSTGKLITASGVLQEGLHKATDHFTVPYSLEYRGQTYHDALPHGDENLTLAGILYHSYNTGTIMTAYNYSTEKRYQYITDFGIGQPTGINFPGESNGLLVSNGNDWDTRTRETVLFGQGYTVNALQMTNVIATIANGGVRLGQRLIEKSTNAQGKDTTPSANESKRVISEETAATMMNMMENIGEEYARVVTVPGYRIAGKSGTAEVAGEGGRLTGIVGDYIIALPADKPQYVIAVFMKNADAYYGGASVGPVVQNIGKFLMQKYQIPQSAPRTDAIPITW
ncbi:penicillin-binding protein 2 [Alloscardovia theropitheci]|uniref:Penicillin-binding protein 2 n=1 Tax=Alloscardovia theropitheci TaxID=2496842 RepID=A0A4R0QX59_9BIFI|nr:penicillin-binding protein 2 [Alloscardovia theropitheci]TCD53971.1 penicillin-binding protein 2 [Alloscardovia theropitheci]